MLLVLMNEILRCYDDAIIQTNQNLKTATVILTSSENPACQVFHDEVRLDVYFHNGFQTVSFIYDNFTYNDTEQIIMQNITITNTRDDGIDLPLFSRLNISSLSYWTMVRVSYLGNQLSQMDQCFDIQQSTFQLFQQKFEFYVYLTEACLDEVTEMAYEFQYQFSTKAETIEIVRKKDFPDSFNCEVIDGNIMHCFVEQNFISEIQTPFLHPVVEFFMRNNGVAYETQIRFENVLVGTVQNLIESVTTQFFKDVFYMEFVLTSDEAEKEAWMRLIDGTDLTIYRLTVSHNNQTTSYQFEYPDFDFSRLILTRSCYGDPDCLITLSQINAASQDAEFYFDITSFRNNDLAGTTGQSFSARISCFRRVVIKIKDSHNVCFQIEKSAYFLEGEHCRQIRDNQISTFSVKAINSSDIHQTCFQAEKQVTFRFDEPEVCFYCKECEALINQLLHEEIFVFLQLTQDINSVTSVGQQCTNSNYLISTVITCSISGIIIVSAFADTLYKIIIFVQITKKSK